MRLWWGRGVLLADTYIEVNAKLQQDGGDPLLDPTLYHRLVSSLRITCHDIG